MRKFMFLSLTLVLSLLLGSVSAFAADPEEGTQSTATVKYVCSDEYPEEVVAALPEQEEATAGQSFNPSSPTKNPVPGKVLIKENGQSIMADAYFHFAGWFFEDETPADSFVPEEGKEYVLYGQWNINLVPASIKHVYDKEYPEEVMATLPEDAELHESSVEPNPPTSRFVRVGNTYYHFAGWDKESVSSRDEFFTGSWNKFTPPDEYSKELLVKFIDEDGNPVTDGTFTDSMVTGNEPSFTIDIFNYFFDEESGEFNSVGKGDADPPYMGPVNSYDTKDGYRLHASMEVDLRDDGYRTREFRNRSADYTFAELETPSGLKPLEGSVIANLNLYNDSITIKSDETGRAYVEGNTLYIVYLKDTETQDAKDAALAELGNMSTEAYSEPEKSEAEDIIENAKEAVQNATSVEEVESALASAKEALSALKTDEEKKAEEEPGKDPDNPQDNPTEDPSDDPTAGDVSDETNTTENDSEDAVEDGDTADDEDLAEEDIAEDSGDDEDTVGDDSAGSRKSSSGEDKNGSSHSTSPKTGDSTYIYMFVSFMVAAGVLLGAIIYRRKLRN